MAITQNTFTGNGSNLGPFSFTFKWLEPTDIKVTVAGVLKTAGTHYNLQNLNYTTKNGGQVLFTAGNAPANGAAIVIYRQTDDTDLAATFYSGSAIRAQDLNSNFTQGLYVTQEANNNVVTANATANTALTNSNTAISTANSAVSTANTASSNASAAVATANTASSNASAAVSTANTASSNATAAVNTANSAASTASTALSTANTALSTANTASSNASTALSTANTASTNASAAVSTANTASSNASSAVSTANTASSNASTALSTANTAISTANAAASAVANAILYNIVANVAAIPASPANNDAVEITDSTGIQSFTPLSGLPVGFVGSSGLSVRLVYTSAGSTWNWIQYFPNDPENRYLNLSGGTLNGQLKADDSISVAAPVYSFDGDTNTGIAHTGADELALVTGGVERASIRSGQFLVGNAATSRGMLLGTNDSVNSNAGIEIFRSAATSNPLNAGMFVTVNPANNNGRANLVLAKTNGNANGSFDAVSAGTLGGVVFAGANGTTITPAAQITGSCSQTPNGTSVPGSLEFWTTASGATYPTQRVTIASDGTFTASNAAVFSSTVAIGSNLTVDTDTLFVDATNNRVGVGTTSPLQPLHVKNAGSTACRLVLENSGSTAAGSTQIYSQNNDLVFDANSSECVRINSSGRVGIGTTGAMAPLNVHTASSNTTFAITRGTVGAEYGYMMAGTDGSTTPGLRFFPVSNGVQGSEVARIDSSGNVGIGRAPTEDLDVYRASGRAVVKVDSDSLANTEIAGFVADGGARSSVIGVYKHSGITNPCSYVALAAEDAANNYLWVDNSDQLRISTTVTHIGTTSGTVVGLQTSDERLKNILGPVEYGLETLKQIDPVRYSLKSEPETEKLGFIAQQVQPLIPQSIFDTNEHIEGEPEDAPTKLGMEYVALIPVLVNAIKELSAEVDALKAQLA